MKKHIRLIVIVTVAALIIGLLLWRFWPHSFSSIMPLEEVRRFSASVSIRHNENGETVFYSYHFISSDPDCINYVAIEIITDILTASDYQQDFRNLIPWDSFKYGDIRLELTFSSKNPKYQPTYVNFYSDNTLTVSYKDSTPYYVFHPTNPEIYQELISLIQTYGIASQ